eukprot:s1065_g2.t1
MRQARVEFPGEQDVGRRVLLCVRPDGSSEPVSFISDATHVKCWCPGLQALLTDQDIQDEYRVKIPADVKQKLARYVQAFVPASVEDSEVVPGNFSFPAMSVRNQESSETSSSSDSSDTSSDSESGEVEGPPQEMHPREMPKPTQREVQMITKLHVNLSHPPRDQFLRILKAAGTKAHILKFVRDEMTCQHCDLQRQPRNRRKSAIPPSYRFNEVLGMDILYINFMNRSVPFLNIVDHGTGFQMTSIVHNKHHEVTGGTPTSADVWRTFQTTWLRYFFEPEITITDQGTEFGARFSRGCEQHGIFQWVTASEAPWQNGRAERHGGWVKSRLTSELESGTCVLETMSDLEEFVSALTSCKNQWYSRGGFSPVQLIFGHGPRVPHEILTDDGPGELGLADLQVDPLDGDTPAAEFSKRFQIRQKARERAIQRDARDRVARAGRAKRYEIKNWNVGQWVYVWRQAAPSVRSSTSHILLPRSRWVGPGAVVLQHGSTVWVQVRAKLWKCDTRQLRPALREEILGVQLSQESDLRELLHSVTPGVRASAVDVAREGDPPAEAWEPTRSDEPETPVLLPPIPEQHPAIVDPQPPPTPVPVPVERFQRQPSQETELPSRPGSTITPRSSDSSKQDSEAKRQRIQDVAPGVQARASVASSTSRPSAVVPLQTQSSPQPDESMDDRMRQAAREMLEFVSRARQSRESGAKSKDEDADLLSALSAMSHVAEVPSSDFYAVENLDSGWCLLVGSTNEISLKNLNAEERVKFDESDAAEWKAIVNTGAVRVLSPNESECVRKETPDRIMSSRIVRRWKPQPGVGCKKAKSRWCVHGHQDCDAPHLQTFSPTPMTESMYLFLLIAMGLGLSIDFADVKNAFCQSNPLHRAAGPVYAEACSGLGLPPGTLIQLVAPVYGLLDAPKAWRDTVRDHLVNRLGFEQNMFENCLFIRRKAGKVESMILVEVDDLVIASNDSCKDEVKQSLMQRFQFGRWVSNEEDYAGRRIRVLSDRVEIFQDKYILENLFPIKLPKARRGQRKDKLLKEEFEAARSLLYKISWVAKETRPEASGMCSILASHLHEGTIEDIHIMNKMVAHLRSTASRPLVLWKFDLDRMAFIVGSDAGGVGSLPESCERALLKLGTFPSIAAEGYSSCRHRVLQASYFEAHASG